MSLFAAGCIVFAKPPRLGGLGFGATCSKPFLPRQEDEDGVLDEDATCQKKNLLRSEVQYRGESSKVVAVRPGMMLREQVNATSNSGTGSAKRNWRASKLNRGGLEALGWES